MLPRRAPTKYAPLVVWLKALPAAEHSVSLTLTEIETLIGDTLPAGAGRPAFWSGSDNAYRNWGRAGWRAQLHKPLQRVRFTRGRP